MPPKKQEDTKVSQENTEAPKVDESTNVSEQKPQSDIERLTKMVEALESQVSILTKSADKTQLARHTPKDTIGRSIRIGTIDGKLVTKWELLTNSVRYDKTGGKVDQTGEFTLDDGSKVPYTMETFRDLMEIKNVDVDLNKCKFNFDDKGNRKEIEEYSFTYKGKEVKLSSTFVNP